MLHRSLQRRRAREFLKRHTRQCVRQRAVARRCHRRLFEGLELGRDVARPGYAVGRLGLHARVRRRVSVHRIREARVRLHVHAQRS